MGAFRWFLAARTISLLGTNIALLALADRFSRSAVLKASHLGSGTAQAGSTVR